MIAHRVNYDDRMTRRGTPFTAQGLIIQEATTVRWPRMACGVYKAGRRLSYIVSKTLY
jgi:hypothetical protein